MGQRPRCPICLPGPKEVCVMREDGWYCYFYTYNETEEESVSVVGMGSDFDLRQKIFFLICGNSSDFAALGKKTSLPMTAWLVTGSLFIRHLLMQK